MKEAKTHRSFLDYVIVNTANGDGYVLKSPKLRGFNDPYHYECHLGNYSTIRKAMESAVTYFMIKRAAIFHANLHHRALGIKTSHEWFVLKRVLEEEKIEMPNELTHSQGFTIELKSKRRLFAEGDK